jgi:hypothetical protein
MRLAEDSNASLIAQTLNTDGTPKRPMNAFMIFARRRRPQVAAENQAMRTGEISKILSKEWNAMELVNNIGPFLNQLCPFHRRLCRQTNSSTSIKQNN